MAPSQDGGARPGAGRKPGGPFGEPTQQIRVPLSQVETVVTYLDAFRQDTVVEHPQPVAIAPDLNLVTFISRVPAGFPSPAADYEGTLNLWAEMVIPGHEASTFILRVAGWSMHGAGIFDGDRVVVDQALNPVKGDVVVAIVNNDLTIKTLGEIDGKPALIAENPHFKPITFKDDESEQLIVWGVVTHCLRSFHRGRRR
ncbi:LexA family protein [Dyella silvatica]|uniref:LexA family protein n=1 Tax=Dyella silvatica TaxID=2992128 RepID=UPI00224E46C2|nr:translesion error-prone DNA polymerase V autoproteolytic subunit [Dyella silvatica]